MSAHELYNRALLVGMPLSPTQETRRLTGLRSSKPASGNLERGSASPGTQHPLRDKRLAKAKSRTYASRVFSLSLVLSPLEPLFSLLRLMCCLHVKGELPSTATRELLPL